MQLVPSSASAQEGTGRHERLGLHVVAQLDVPLVVVDYQLALAWANPEAKASGGSAWAVLFDPAGGSDQFELRRQLQALVLGCLRKQSPAEALLKSVDGTWFASAAPLRDHTGLALMRLSAMHQLARGVRGRLRRLFDLTSAEAEITVHLADGWSLERIAAVRRVSVDTVRAQVRSIFRKTGTHRQGELICAVGRLIAG